MKYCKCMRKKEKKERLKDSDVRILECLNQENTVFSQQKFNQRLTKFLLHMNLIMI